MLALSPSNDDLTTKFASAATISTRTLSDQLLENVSAFLPTESAGFARSYSEGHQNRCDKL